ncbi:MAG: protein arginine kinase [Clostridia bacterium]|nr:protein arginine kinase [Clostridia bacterium]
MAIKGGKNMNWYMQTGTNGDVAISTRIRFARNLNGFRFNLTDKNEIEKLENKIKDNLFAIGYGLKFFKLKDIDEITKQSLIEKNIISPDFLRKNDYGAILINDEENICIMINEEDHLRIQVFNSGLDLKNTLNLAIELDEKLGQILNFAKSKKYGYLTSCPSNCGTGLRASVMLHLPALKITGNIEKVLQAVNSFGISIRGMYGENSQSVGDIYQISNSQTIGMSEEDIINNLRIIVEKVIKQERTARKILTKNEIELEDKIYRCYGILANCKKITSEEALELLSYVKLGTDLGLLQELTDYKVLQLYILTKPANLQKYVGNKLDTIERDIKRAEIIKQIISK